MADAKLSGATFSRVSSASGPERTLVAQGTAGGDLFRKNNFGATTAPGPSDDATVAGGEYSKGSFWYNGVRGILYVCHDSTAGAAIWRRVRRGHIGYVVGNWYAGESAGNPVASATATAAGTRMYLHPFFVPEPITISDLGFSTAQTVAGNTQLAIYRGNGPNGRPGTRIGVIASVANAAVATSYSGPLVDGNLVLEPGWYWGAGITDVASTFVTANPTQNAGQTASLGSPTLANVAKALGALIGYDLATTFNTDPKVTFPADLSSSTLTDHTTGRFPLVFFKVAAVPTA